MDNYPCPNFSIVRASQVQHIKTNDVGAFVVKERARLLFPQEIRWRGPPLLPTSLSSRWMDLMITVKSVAIYVIWLKIQGSTHCCLFPIGGGQRTTITKGTSGLQQAQQVVIANSHVHRPFPSSLQVASCCCSSGLAVFDPTHQPIYDYTQGSFPIGPKKQVGFMCKTHQIMSEQKT